jgi:hypothetical protein
MIMADVPYAKAQAENLITILAHDPVNGRLVARLIEPQLFEGELRNIAERCVAYWKRHKTAPGVHTADLFADILDDERNRKASTYRRILRSMEMLTEGINTDYVMTTLRTFSRVQRMKDAILKSAEKLNAQQELAIGEVEEILADLLRAREYEFDAGMTLNDSDKVFEYLATHYSEFRMGIEAFDRRDIVPSRGAIFLVLGSTGKGKSWALMHCGKQALLQRKKVLHITLEMPAEEVVLRYYQMLMSIAKRPSDDKDHQVAQFEVDDDGYFEEVTDIEAITPGYTLRDPLARKLLEKDLKRLRRMRITDWLRVARFAPRSLSMNGLRAYLDGLESTGFIPDMVCLDYIGITKTDADNHRITLGRALEDFRAVMVERNMAGVTAHQTSKEGAEAKTVKATHVAEDWSLIGTSDIAITFSQTDPEKRVGLARLFVSKARSEEDHFGVVITQTYRAGQFALQSALLHRGYYDYEGTLPKQDRSEKDAEDEDKKKAPRDDARGPRVTRRRRT